MVGAASDTLANQLGENDICCGRDSDSIGCGKCILVSNPNSVKSTWKAIVMKKSRCPPWSNGCGAGQLHMDFAVPGYDNLQYSTANICNNPKSGFTSQAQSAVCGSWYTSSSSTQGCFSKCSSLPPALRAGCELFSIWGWKVGNPQLTYQIVNCPPRFKSYIQSLFGISGPNTNVKVPTTITQTLNSNLTPNPTVPILNPTVPTTPVTTPTTTPASVKFINCNNYWIQYQVDTSSNILRSTFQYSGGTIQMSKSTWSSSVFAQGPPSQVKDGESVIIMIYTPNQTITVSLKWMNWNSATQTVTSQKNTLQMDDVEDETLN